MIKIDTQKAIRLYRDEKIPLIALSKIIGCSVGTLIHRLGQYGIEIRSHGNHMEKVKLEQIKYDYEILKLSTTQIAKKYNMSASSVWERLKKNGVNIKNQKEAVFDAIHKIPLSKYKEICDLYINDKSNNCGKIARIYNVHKTTISSVLKKNGILIEQSFGKRNPAYKGGITPLHTRIRHCEKSNIWRKTCMERDCYKCRFTGQNGSLQVHHYPKTFSEIFKDFLLLYSNLDPIKDLNELLELCQNYEPFWNIDNGITVCNKIHKQLHSNNLDLCV